MAKFRIIETREGGRERHVEAYMLFYTDNAILFFDDNHRVLHVAPIDKVIVIKENE